MGTIERFEDLEAWKLARALTGLVYAASGTGNFVRDFALRDQIRRASISIVSNIAEGFGRWHSKEFVHFLLVANGSLKELETHVLIGKRLGFFSTPELAKPVSLVEEIGRMLAAPRKRLER